MFAASAGENRPLRQIELPGRAKYLRTIWAEMSRKEKEEDIANGKIDLNI